MTTAPPDPPMAPAAPLPPHRRRRPAKVLQVAGLLLATLLASVPIAGIIHEREERQAEMRAEIMRSWSPAQTVHAPVLAVPYTAAHGKTGGYLKIAPRELSTQAVLAPERKKRGLFSAIVYTTTLDMTGTLAIPSAADLEAITGPGGAVFWEDAVVLLQASGLTGMTAGDRIVWDGRTLPWRACYELVPHAGDCSDAPLVARPALTAATAAANAEIPFQATVTLRGTEAFRQSVYSRQTTAVVKAPWPTPSFTGSVLPADPTVTDDGFEARWRMLDFSRPQLWSTVRLSETPDPDCLPSIGVTLLEAVPTYRMINRASKYALLFIVLSFTVYALFELLSAVRIHVVQYGLLGLSMTLFALLLVSFAEPLGYAAGYWISAGLVLSQATAYTAAVTRRLLSTLIFAVVLSGLFGFLYVLLSLESYALLAGSVALFLTLSVIMAVTQRVDWRGERP
ncbi:inner membrane protein [Azospirillum agricola]|uniref:cell envelope integrity protein CreD n=1 Tax=Azospirillum agricola TaxID=1720247 RepID=UPI001AE7FE7C|nr:cell envelope integrity protein CreD [Azospirillum agricola]MBP2227700.1 inner membrane protein [Azospirillum agricola]